MDKRISTLPLLLALLLSAPAARAQATQTQTTPQSPPRAQAEGKKDEPKKEGARRHETVQFESRLVGAPLPYNVVLPADYNR